MRGLWPALCEWSSSAHWEAWTCSRSQCLYVGVPGSEHRSLWLEKACPFHFISLPTLCQFTMWVFTSRVWFLSQMLLSLTKSHWGPVSKKVVQCFELHFSPLHLEDRLTIEYCAKEIKSQLKLLYWPKYSLYSMAGAYRFTGSQHCWRSGQPTWWRSYIYCNDAPKWGGSSDPETQSKLSWWSWSPMQIWQKFW